MAWISLGALPCRKINLMTARVSIFFKSRASLTCFRACFFPGRAKDLSAPPVYGASSQKTEIDIFNFCGSSVLVPSVLENFLMFWPNCGPRVMNSFERLVSSAEKKPYKVVSKYTWLRTETSLAEAGTRNRIRTEVECELPMSPAVVTCCCILFFGMCIGHRTEIYRRRMLVGMYPFQARNLCLKTGFLGGEEKCLRGFFVLIWRKEPTWKILADIVG